MQLMILAAASSIETAEFGDSLKNSGLPSTILSDKKCDG